MNGPATTEELRRAYERSLLPAQGMTFDQAERSPAHAALLRAMALSRRQMLRDLARQARGRFIERTCVDFTPEASR